MSEYTTLDVRELDNLFLATIGGADYFETRQIVKQEHGRRSIVGRASDWPLIEARARAADFEALATRFAQLLSDSDCHVGELLSRRSGYEDEIASLKAHIAALETCLAEQAPPAPEPSEPPAAAPVDDGKVACDVCGQRVKTRGLLNHKRMAHGIPTTGPAEPAAPAAPPAHILEALELPERPWSCAECGSSTYTRSIAQPALCLRCAAAAAEPATNGHLAVA